MANLASVTERVIQINKRSFGIPKQPQCERPKAQRQYPFANGQPYRQLVAKC